MTEHPGFDEVPAGEYLATAGDHQLIDVREPFEFATGSVPHAVNIPVGDLLSRLDEIDHDRPVALLCRSGNRSRHAAAQLAAHGFTDITNLAGGVLALSLDQPARTSDQGAS